MKSPFQLIVSRNGASRGRILSGGYPISFSEKTRKFSKPFKKANELAEQREKTKEKQEMTELKKRRLLLTPPGIPVERPYLERHNTLIGGFRKRRLI